MDENTWGRVKFLVNLMFCRLDKFDGPVFERGEEGIYMGAYIRDSNWVTYLVSVYSVGFYTGGLINGILRYSDVQLQKHRKILFLWL